MRSFVSVNFTEREGEPGENSVVKTTSFEDDGLQINEHVLPVIEEAMRGFGFVFDGKRLALVDEDEEE